MIEIILILGGLFLTALLAATIFPAQSELLLVGLLLNSAISPVLLIAVASCGNILGSCINWFLGRQIERFKSRRWFPVRLQSLDKAQDRYRRYGRLSLLLSWMPIIGDPITVIAGVLREEFRVFLLLVSIAKTGRYIVLAVIALQHT